MLRRHRSPEWQDETLAPPSLVHPPRPQLDGVRRWAVVARCTGRDGAEAGASGGGRGHVIGKEGNG